MNQPTGTFGTIILRPHWLQWVVDKAPWIAVNIFGYCWYHMTPLPDLILFLMIAMSIHLTYMLLYLTMTRFTVTDEVLFY